MVYAATPSQVKRGEEIRALEAEGKFDEANRLRGVGGVPDEDAVEKAQDAADQANKEAVPSEAAPFRKEGVTGTEESTTGQRASKRAASSK